MDGTDLEIQIANLGGGSFETVIKVEEGCPDISRTLEMMKRVYQVIEDLKKCRKKTFREIPSIYQNNVFAEETIRPVRFVVGSKETYG